MQKTKAKPAAKLPETPIDQVLTAFKSYQDKTSEVLADHIASDELIAALASEDVDFEEAVRAIDDEITVDKIVEWLEKQDLTNGEACEILGPIKGNLDRSDVKSIYHEGDEVITVRVDNMVLRDKLLDFIRREIITDLNQEAENLFY